jgi:chemotaxis protein MotB
VDTQHLKIPPSDSPDVDSGERSQRVWLITFTDLVALMLAFFVMLFAMSNVKVSDWQNVIDSLSQTLRPTLEKTIPASTSSFNIGTIFRGQAINLDYLASVIGDAIDGPLLSQSRILLLEDRLMIVLPGDLLFAPGTAEMTGPGRQALFVLGGVLRNIGNEIGVNGHSGSAPPVVGRYASNWELSTARAATVANALRQSGYLKDITAFGYADSRPVHGVADDMAGTLARRVEIIIRPEAGGGR